MLGGGSGSRVGATVNKVYLPLAGRKVVSWSFTWASQVASVVQYVLVVRPEDLAVAQETIRREIRLPVTVVTGGDTRHGSEWAALSALEPQIEAGLIDVVVIHDGARPLAAPSLWWSVISTAAAVGGALPCLPAPSLLPPPAQPDPPGAALPADVAQTGSTLVRVQTPQAFQAKHLLSAYVQARRAGYVGTDTSSTAEAFSSMTIRGVSGQRTNLKITYAHDLFLAERLLAVKEYRLT